MKKLLFITILSTILVCLINIFSFYLFNYPDKTDIWKIIKYYTEWKELIFIYSLVFSVTILLSLFLFKEHKFITKFYVFIIGFNAILFIFISVKGLNSLIENKKQHSSKVKFHLLLRKKPARNRFLLLKIYWI